MKIIIKIKTSIGRGSSCWHRESRLDDLVVDRVHNVHAFAKLLLIVRLSTFSLDELSHPINLRFIHDHFLFKIIEHIVQIICENLILLGVVLHGMESSLLINARVKHL